MTYNIISTEDYASNQVLELIKNGKSITGFGYTKVMESKEKEQIF